MGGHAGNCCSFFVSGRQAGHAWPAVLLPLPPALQRLAACLAPVLDQSTPSPHILLLQNDEQLVLGAPFQGFSLQEVALFLRLLYNQEWREGVADTLRELHGSLPALLRLVHRLDVPGLLVTLTKYMAGAVRAGTGAEDGFGGTG